MTLETKGGKKYLIKQERNNKEFQPQFISEDPKMYGYEYMEGDLMREVWQNLTESEKIDICRKFGYFHADNSVC